MIYLILSAIALVGVSVALYQMRTHPKGLYVLFFAEMWERFSYYGMRGLLILYLTKHFIFSDTQAYGIYGAYTTLVYVTPVIGGILADQFLGQRKAVLWGAVLLVAGHLGMAFEGEQVVDATQRDGMVMNIFYLSLALIICGVGFLKANISAIVGELYDKTDERRDGAFTLFYVGINLGAFAGALIAGYLGETYGWKYGFGLAGIGMLFGLVVFVWGKPLLNGAGESPNPVLLAKKQMGIMSTEWLIYLGTLLAVFVIWMAIGDYKIVGYILWPAFIATFLYIIIRSVATLPPHPRNRIFAALFLISIQVLFWALFEQAGSSLNLYTDREVDRQGVPASVFQSLNAMYIIVLGPVFAALWVWLAKKGKEPSAPAKFGLGVVQLGLGFLVLVWGAKMAGADLTPVLFIFLIYLLHTTGELCLSPVGLSAMTRLSVPKMVGLVMGAWFISSAAGNFVAAQIAKMTAGGGEGQVLEVYSKVGWMAVVVGVGLIVVAPLVKRFMHLDTLEEDTRQYNIKAGLSEDDKEFGLDDVVPAGNKS